MADLGFWKGRALFSKGGAVVGKNHFLRPIRGSVNSFFVRFCWEKSKIFREGEAIVPQRPPLNPPLGSISVFVPFFMAFPNKFSVSTKNEQHELH